MGFQFLLSLGPLAFSCESVSVVTKSLVTFSPVITSTYPHLTR